MENKMSGEKRMRLLEELLGLPPSEETNPQEDSSEREERWRISEKSFEERIIERQAREREAREREGEEMREILEEEQRRLRRVNNSLDELLNISEENLRTSQLEEGNESGLMDEYERMEEEDENEDEMMNEEGMVVDEDENDGMVDEDEDLEERVKKREIQKIKTPRSKEEIIKKGIRHPVFDLAETAPLFFIKGKVYAVEDRIDYSGDHFNGAPLIQVGDLRELDELFLERADSELEEFKEVYIKDIKKRYIELQNQEGLDLAQYLYAKIFPLLTGENYRKKTLENLDIESSEESEEKERIKVNRKELEKLVLEVENKINREKIILLEGSKKREAKKGKIENLLGIQENILEEEEEGILLKGIIEERDIALIDGGCYALSKKGKAYALKLIVEGNTFYLDPKTPESKNFEFEETEQLEEKFEEGLERILKIEALEEKLTREDIAEELSMQDADLIRMKGAETYEKDNFSFKKLPNGMYELNEALSPFIVTCQNKYYIFDKPVVSIRISNVKGEYIPEKDLYLKNRSYQKGLCMGRNELPHTKTYEEAIVKYLKKARDMVTGGFAPDWLNEGALPMCTKVEAERLDIPILDVMKGGKKI